MLLLKGRLGDVKPFSRFADAFRLNHVGKIAKLAKVHGLHVSVVAQAFLAGMPLLTT